MGPYHRIIVPLLNRWDNDFAVSILSGDPLRPMTKETTEDRYERDSKDEQRHRIDFIIYERAGFRIIGRRREANRWGENLYDEVMMDCLSTEFHNPIKPMLELP